MAESVNIEIEGLHELKIALRGLPKNLRRTALNNSLRVGARVIIKAQKAEVVSKGLVDTGKMRSSIKSKTTPKSRLFGKDAEIRIGVLSDIEKGGLSRGFVRPSSVPLWRRGKTIHTGLTGFSNSDVYYWRFHEFGTSSMQARPFMVPGFYASRYQANKAILRSLKHSIEKQALKAKKPVVRR